MHRALDFDAPFYVAGHTGLVGRALLWALKDRGFTNILKRTSSELDLRNRDEVCSFFADEKPTYVILAAARVGGIGANNEFPFEFLSDNLQIQTNVLDAAHQQNVEKLVFLGSSCIYPRNAPQPIPESALLTGILEKTNDAYAIAKISGILHVQAARRQYGHDWISVMPTNLFGPGDNYDEHSSHVLPALIGRYERARLSREELITNWGSGDPLREFLYVDDLADAILLLMEKYSDPSPINVGSGHETSIRDLASLISKVVGFNGRTSWDVSKPDGTPRKLLDSSRIRAFGWEPRWSLEAGIESAIKDFRDMRKNSDLI